VDIVHVIKSALLWVIMQRVVVISCRRFGGTIPTICLETSVINYHYSSRNNTEDCGSHLLPNTLSGFEVHMLPTIGV